MPAPYSKKAIAAARARGCKSVEEYLEIKRMGSLQLEVDLLRAKLVIRNAQLRMQAGQLAFLLKTSYLSMHRFLNATCDDVNLHQMLKIIEVGQQLLDQDARGDFF
jgi:hypothetical protein